MNFYKHPDLYGQLRQLYWHLRYRRSFDTAARRKWYRRIKAERERLVSGGASAEHVRLYCRYMSNPLPDCPALRRLVAYEAAVVEYQRLQSRLVIQNTAKAYPAVTQIAAQKPILPSTEKLETADKQAALSRPCIEVPVI